MTRHNTPSATSLLTSSYLCEYAQQPFVDCYCRNVSGRTVPNVVFYCMERFDDCPVYRKQLQQKSNSAEERITSKEDMNA